MGKSTRTTISVPAELKARMDAVEEPTNWSAVACAAFERKLAEIITRKGARDMKDVIDRLRVSMKQLGNDLHNEGLRAGQDWAKQQAEAAELERLEILYERAGQDWDRLFDNGASNAYSPGEWLVFAIQPDTDRNRKAAYEFWETVAGDDHERLRRDSDYVRGFAVGALDVWSEVKRQL